MAELVAGPGTSTLVLRSTVLSANVGGYSFAGVRGIQAVGNRLFANFADPVNRFALAKYSFNPSPGSGAVGSAPLNVLFDGAGTQPDHFPGVFINGGFRLHKFTHGNGNETQLFSGSGNGYVLQMSYFADTDLLTSSPLRYWHNHAFYNEIDCQITNMAAPGLPPDLRLTIAKWTETFAIAQPFPFH